MGKIGLHNYEVYLLDYLEGHLSVPLRKEMQDFLKAHPSIAEEAEGLGALRLVADPVAFPDIDSLYQAEAAILEETQEMLFLQAADGSLEHQGQKRLALWLNEHPEAGREYRAAMLTRLIPDEEIVFAGKATLKKSIPLYRHPLFHSLSRAAAIFLLVLLSLTWLLRPVEDTQPAYGSLINVPLDEFTASPDVPETRLQNPTEFDRNITGVLDSEKEPERQAASLAAAERQDAPEPATTPDPFSLSIPSITLENVASLHSLTYSNPAWIAYRSTPYNNAAAVGALIANGPPPREKERAVNLSWLFGRKNYNPALNPSSGRTPNPVFWDIADAGISTINALTDQRLTLERDVDDEGNTVAYALYSEGFEITRKRRFD